MILMLHLLSYIIADILAALTLTFYQCQKQILLFPTTQFGNYGEWLFLRPTLNEGIIIQLHYYLRYRCCFFHWVRTLESALWYKLHTILKGCMKILRVRWNVFARSCSFITRLLYFFLIFAIRILNFVIAIPCFLVLSFFERIFGKRLLLLATFWSFLISNFRLLLLLMKVLRKESRLLLVLSNYLTWIIHLVVDLVVLMILLKSCWWLPTSSLAFIPPITLMSLLRVIHLSCGYMKLRFLLLIWRRVENYLLRGHYKLLLRHFLLIHNLVPWLRHLLKLTYLYHSLGWGIEHELLWMLNRNSILLVHLLKFIGKPLT